MDIKFGLSMDLFEKAETYNEFLDLWSKFYSNEICIPLIYGNFVDGEYPHTFQMGKKCQKIVKRGIIISSFGPSELETSHRGYVTAFVPNRYNVKTLSENINRCPGFIAFYQDIEDKFSPKGLVIGYDPRDEETEITLKTGILHGAPFARLGYQGEDELEMIRECLSEPLKEIINADNFKMLTVIDTVPSGKSDKILDVILSFL